MYYPTIKSKNGPLNAVATHLSAEVCPLIKLTKLAVGSDSKLGDAPASANAISSAIGSMPFFIDIDDAPKDRVLSYGYLTDPSEGYSAWCEFVRQNFGKNCRPVLQVTGDDTGDCIYQEIKQITKSFKYIGVVLPFDLSEDEIKPLNDAISRAGVNDRTTYFVDFGQINSDQFDFARTTGDWSVVNEFEVIRSIGQNAAANVRPRVVTISSSFPLSVVVDVPQEAGAQGFSSGKRALTDYSLNSEAARRFGNIVEIMFGDYASVNQSAVQGAAGAWIPRIDITDRDSFTFFRQRTKANLNKSLAKAGLKQDVLPQDNGQALAMIAKEIRDNGYIDWILDDYVRNQVLDAARGKPKRADATFWVSLRVQEHIAKMAKYFSK